MKVWFSILSLSLALFLLASGCSKEEQSPAPTEKPKVVKRIVKPEPESRETEQPVAEAAPSPEENSREVTQPPVSPEKEGVLPVSGNTDPPPPSDQAEGYYTVEEGESLAIIAGKEEVYGDPLKWPILCRYDPEELAPIAMDKGFPYKALPKGLRLKVIGREEAQKNIKARAEYIWVVNVMSSMSMEEIEVPAIRLIKEGYPVYITRVKVKGKDWMRLRAGFFKSRTEAEKIGKKVISLLNFRDLWVTKAGKSEIEEFGGY